MYKIHTNQCRDRWRKLARKSGDHITWCTYRNCRSEVKRLLGLPQKYDPNNSTNMRKIIRTCIPKKSNGNKYFSVDDKSVANNFNEFFTSGGSNTVKKIQSLVNENKYTIHQSSSRTVILSLNCFPLNLWSPL